MAGQLQEQRWSGVASSISGPDFVGYRGLSPALFQQLMDSLVADEPVALAAADRAGDPIGRPCDYGGDILRLACIAE